MTREVFKGEAQFLAWGDGPAGPWIKLLLPDSDDLAPVRGMTKAKAGMAGQLLAVMIVEVDPDNPAQASPEPEPTEAAHRKLGPLGKFAVVACKNPAFLEWLSVKTQQAMNEESARLWVLDLCAIGSRRDLDTVPSAAEIFNREVRLPWLLANQ